MAKTKRKPARKPLSKHGRRCDQCKAPHGEGVFYCRIGATRHRAYLCDGVFYHEDTGEKLGPGKVPATRRFIVIRLRQVTLLGGCSGDRRVMLCQHCIAVLNRPIAKARREATGRGPGRPRKVSGQLALDL